MQPTVGIGLDDQHERLSRFLAFVAIGRACAARRLFESVLLAFFSRSDVPGKRQDARPVFEVDAQCGEGRPAERSILAAEHDLSVTLDAAVGELRQSGSEVTPVRAQLELFRGPAEDLPAP